MIRARLSTMLFALGVLLASTVGTFAVPRTAADMTAVAPLLTHVQMSQAKVQTGPNGIGDPQRCLTIRKCQFQRGGSFRGCISTYSCRVCRLVEASCEIGGRSQNCREMRCTWG